MSTIEFEKKNGSIFGEVLLPTSKSLSNRALIIQSLCAQPFQIHQLSNADDTQNLLQLLLNDPPNYHVGAAGTNMRFLISLLAIKEGVRILTGSKRMLERPIGELVEGLRSIGADIRYMQKEGYPPIEIKGKKLAGGKIQIDGSISSQYISSLLMIAPHLQNGLSIKILNGCVSWPYIEMTLSLMQYFGVQSKVSDLNITIAPQKYLPLDYTVEADWSAASFWYGIIATSTIGSKILLKDLSEKSLQGDKKAASYFIDLGVTTTETPKGMLIEKNGDTKKGIHFSLLNEPDLFPPLAFACAALRIKADFDGLQTLNLKESKRIESVKVELEKTGAICSSSNDEFYLTGYHSMPDEIIFDTYQDHRLAMAASIFLRSCKKVTIRDTQVISKSYPQFWEELKKI